MKHTQTEYFTVYRGKIKKVEHIKKRWYNDTETCKKVLISDRNIFATLESAEQSLAARRRQKKEKKERIMQEYLFDEQRREQIFNENSWLFDLDNIHLGFMVADELEYFVRKYKKVYTKTLNKNIKQ